MFFIRDEWDKNIDNLALKQFYSNSFIQRCPSIALQRNNVFHSFSKTYILALQSFSLAWLSHVKLQKVILALFVS